MKYVKAATVLPENLIAEIQKYVQGETIYIPKQETKHYKWGTRSGGRKQLDARNRDIKHAFKSGTTIHQLEIISAFCVYFVYESFSTFYKISVLYTIKRDQQFVWSDNNGSIY
ncbi:CD3324 family protein [Bacillus pseudomycoides]|uniref:CD3324 family protein n=1 Tax=Bacillus pseudomycoides TaxID=64104 RepID=UPI003F658CE2